MKDKRLRDKFYNTSDQELRFTKEDRNEVFEQIHKLEKRIIHKRNHLFLLQKNSLHLQFLY